jgi:hypothetical protein
MALILVGVTVYLAAKLINDYEIPKIIPEPDEFHEYSGNTSRPLHGVFRP